MKRTFPNSELNAMRNLAASTIHHYAIELPTMRGELPADGTIRKLASIVHDDETLAILKLAQSVLVLENEVRYPPTVWNRLRRKIGLLP